MTGLGQRLLLIYAVISTTVLTVVLLSGAATPKKDFDQITVQRINVVEPDGTLRMVISDRTKLPGVIVRGKEHPPEEERPQAGMLFYNDEGSENGGLIFGGRRNAKGEVIDSGGSLSFDRYDASQEVQLAGVNDKENNFAGLAVSDSLPAGENHQRIWVGRRRDGIAVISLMDGKGHARISLEVPADGTPRLAFLDAEGKVTNQIVPEKAH